VITFLILQQAPVPVTGTGMNELLWQQQALLIYNAMIARGYTQMAAEWKAFYPDFHRAHPQLSPRQVESAFVAELLAGGLSAAITQAGGTLGGIPQAAATGAEKAIATITNPLDWLKYPADFFYRLTQPSTWLRIGEFVVGAMLIYVGIKAVATPGGATGAAKSGVRGAKKTGGGVTNIAKNLTPTGRAARTVVRHEQRVQSRKTRANAAQIRATYGRRGLCLRYRNSGRKKGNPQISSRMSQNPSIRPLFQSRSYSAKFRTSHPVSRHS